MARRVLLCLLCALVVAACKVETTVDITLREDGTGRVRATITLDADAVARATGPTGTLAEAVRLDDLRAAGWRDSGWDDLDQGGARLTLEHAYVGERELAQRLRDLAGSDGTLRDARITRTRSFVESHDSISLRADLRDIVTGIRDDPELVESLRAAGLDVDMLDAQLQTELRDSLHLRVVLHAPDGVRVERDVRVGERATITASRTATDTSRLLWIGAGALLALVALGLLLAASVSARRKRRRGRRARPAAP